MGIDHDNVSSSLHFTARKKQQEEGIQHGAASATDSDSDSDIYTGAGYSLVHAMHTADECIPTQAPGEAQPVDKGGRRDRDDT